MKSYHVLECANQKQIAQQLYSFLSKKDGPLERNNLEFWNFLNKKNLFNCLKECPALSQWFEILGLKVREASFTIYNNEIKTHPHVDAPPVVAKINFPVCNTKNTYNVWFDENKKLKLKAIKRGNRHYTADFHVDFIDGTDAWIEVKGYLRPGDRTKLKRFKKWYPDDFKKLWVVVGTDKTEAYRFFLDKLLVPKKHILLYKDLTLKYKKEIVYWEG